MTTPFETKKLYWNDPYQKQCFARVVKIENDHVWLDQTIFYPESGGQAGDRGYVNQYLVTDTRFDSEKNIYLIIENASKLLHVGEEIKCTLDWDRRYLIMKLHAASHIMEHFLFVHFGKLKLLGSNVNEERDSSTYAWDGTFDERKLKEVEQQVNQLIAEHYPIENYEDSTKKNFRWWKCATICIPCGGTHPRNTQEIGAVRLKKESGGKGKIKIKTFLASE